MSFRNVANDFDNAVNKSMNFIDNNEYLSVGLGLFLILYAGLAAPKLPETIAKLFDNIIFKFIVLFLVAYGARKNPTIAIIAVVALLISIQALNRIKLNKVLMGIMGKEGMEEVAGEEMAEEMPEEMPEEMVPSESMPQCTQVGQFRNSFYPQYVNMKPDSYMARYTGGDVSGFDPNASYA